MDNRPTQDEIRKICKRKRNTNEFYLVSVDLPHGIGKFFFIIFWSFEKRQFIAQPVWPTDGELIKIIVNMSNEICKICRHYLKRVYGVRHISGVNQTLDTEMIKYIGITII